MNRDLVIFLNQSSTSSKTSPRDYAQSCELYQIFAQITRVVARKNNINASQALSEYLNQCNKGQHVVLKSYSSFSKSIVNRQCFLYNFCKIFQTETNLRNGLDYYQLFRLLCSDFPKDIILNAVRIVEGEHEKMMEVLINSQKFLNALYISFIYNEYLDQFLQKVFKGKHEEEVPIIQIFEWVVSQNQLRKNSLQKPSIEILTQIILNIIVDKPEGGGGKGQNIKFINEFNMKDYIYSAVGQNKNAITISYNKFIFKLLENKRHEKFVSRVIFGFENSGNWANDAVKIISVKDVQNPQPLNAKKIKKK